MHLFFDLDHVTITAENFSKFIIRHAHWCIIYNDLYYGWFEIILKYHVFAENIQPLYKNSFDCSFLKDRWIDLGHFWG